VGMDWIELAQNRVQWQACVLCKHKRREFLDQLRYYQHFKEFAIPWSQIPLTAMQVSFK
jgi:hypothetical protein